VKDTPMPNYENGGTPAANASTTNDNTPTSSEMIAALRRGD
jgi:hypothetical protein